jgi:hypothetical protein
MRSIFAVVVLVVALTPLAPAMADECDARAADLVRESGATFVRRSTVKIFLQLEGFKNLAVECWPSPGVEADVNEGLPPDSFFDFVARAAHLVVGLSAEAMKAGAVLCHKGALRSADNLAELEYRGAQFSCESFTRNGGSTSIAVFKMK